MAKNTQPEAPAGLSAEGWLRDQPIALQRDCRTLLLDRLGWRYTDWALRRQDPLTAAELTTLKQDGARLAAGEPLAYVLGSAPFRELMLEVSPAVLIPRPETELIVEHALTALRRLERRHGADQTTLRILDAGTGSGAIILGLGQALATCTPAIPVELVACDRSSTALATARRNGATTGLTVEWLKSDWLTGVPGNFDLLLSNPPYLADGDPHLSDLTAEPPEALIAGPSGLEALRILATTAAERLTTGGVIIVEHGAAQGAATRDLLTQAGLTHVLTHPDQYGNERFTEGWRHE